MIVMLSALVLAAMQTSEPVRIEPRWDGSTCSILMDGTPGSVEKLATEMKRWARHGRPIAVIGAMEIPYRCIGSTIFTLQANDYRASRDIGPSPTYSVLMHTTVRFSVMPGTCAYLVNDAPVTESELMALMADWKRYDTRVRLMPNPNAEYRCVDSALTLMKRADLSNLGFVGNDQYAPAEPK